MSKSLEKVASATETAGKSSITINVETAIAAAQTKASAQADYSAKDALEAAKPLLKVHLTAKLLKRLLNKHRQPQQQQMLQLKQQYKLNVIRINKFLKQQLQQKKQQRQLKQQQHKQLKKQHKLQQRQQHRQQQMQLKQQQQRQLKQPRRQQHKQLKTQLMLHDQQLLMQEYQSFNQQWSLGKMIQE